MPPIFSGKLERRQDIVALLLLNGADRSIRNIYGSTAEEEASPNIRALKLFKKSDELAEFTKNIDPLKESGCCPWSTLLQELTEGEHRAIPQACKIELEIGSLHAAEVQLELQSNICPKLICFSKGVAKIEPCYL
jgi:hypothetical protein